MSEQKKLSNEDEIQTFLEGMGFEADETKKGLYRKGDKDDADGYTCYWDFRKTPKGRFYVTHNKTTDDDRSEFWLDKDAQQLPEYVEVRKALGGEEKPPRKQKETVKPHVCLNEGTPPESSLVVADENDAHTLMNIKDDAQVLAEMEGKYLAEFVYSFDQGSRKITGLSYAGVKEVARSAGNIGVEDLIISETEKTYRVLAKARDSTRNMVMYGVAEQPKMLRMRNGDMVEDLHGLSKAVSRAQRNALRVLIPELTIKKMIEKYLEAKKEA
jgi:hypothetical protein